LDELGGKKLSPGRVLIPVDEKGKVEKLFKKFNICYELALSQSDGINVHAAKEILQLSLRVTVGSAAIS